MKGLSLSCPGSQHGDAAVREILANAGVPSDRFTSVSGKGDTEPLVKDNPYLPYNRRVGIVLKADAPPLPTGLRP